LFLTATLNNLVSIAALIAAFPSTRDTFQPLASFVFALSAATLSAQLATLNQCSQSQPFFSGALTCRAIA
jgi:hypothetical protein